MQANFPNANMAGMGMGVGVSGIPQAQMQANMQQQGQQRMGPPPDNMRLAMQRAQFPAAASNQHQFQLQQQQINMVSNLASAHLGAGNGIQTTAGMMAAMAAGQNLNGNANAALNGLGGAAGSPRLGQVNNPAAARPSLSSGQIHIQQLQNTIKQQHPEWSPDQIKQAAGEQLQKILHRNNALRAASGATGMGNGTSQIGNNFYMQNGGGGAAGMGGGAGGMGGGVMGGASSPPPNAVQNYQTQLLQQQRMMSQQQRNAQVAQQAQAQAQAQHQVQSGSPSLGSVRPESRSATPKNGSQQNSSQNIGGLGQSPSLGSGTGGLGR